MSTAPAKLFGLFPRKGTIAVGSDADIVLWDPNKTVTLTNAHDASRRRLHAVRGYAVTGYPFATYVRGRAIFREGAVLGKGGGAQLARPEYPLIQRSGRLPTPFDPVAARLSADGA